MENAAIGLLPAARQMLGKDERTVVIVCGPGNNGGDGLALARHLLNDRVSVRVVTLAEPETLRGDAAVNMQIIQRLAKTDHALKVGSLEQALDNAPTLIVDAMFGTGLGRPISGHAAEAVRWIADQRARGSRVLAIDVPSGLDAQTGQPLGSTCVRADATVTLAGIKPGLTRLESQAFVGDLSVATIGVPESLLSRFGTPWNPPNGLGRTDRQA